MKNLILITLLFIAFGTKAQTTKPIDGFLGIKFGSTSTQVKAALKAKGAVLNDDATADLISFNNVKLGERQVSALFVVFVNDQAYEASFVFRADQEAKSIEYYDDLVKDLNEVYGAGKGSKKFKSPYEEGDGYEITAIKTGNADYTTIWENGDNYIIALINTAKRDNGVTVRLSYSDGKLLKLAEDKQKAKNKSEY